MQTSGILRIEIRHIDLKNQRWVLPRSEAKGKQAPRIVYLNDKVITIMQRLIGKSNGRVAFLNSRGKPWTTSASIVRSSEFNIAWAWRK
jgi:integrase